MNKNNAFAIPITFKQRFPINTVTTALLLWSGVVREKVMVAIS